MAAKFRPCEDRLVEQDLINEIATQVLARLDAGDPIACMAPFMTCVNIALQDPTMTEGRAKYLASMAMKQEGMR